MAQPQSREALKETEFGQRLLADAGKILASSLGYAERLKGVARLVIPHLADWCVIDLIEEDESLHMLAVAHQDQTKVELAKQFRHKYPPTLESSTTLSHVIQTGHPKLYADISKRDLEQALAPYKKINHELLQGFHPRSAMVVPLIARGKRLGAITFIWTESDRRYNRRDLALAQELALRIAIALDNAKLYESEHAARQVAERTAQRLSTLQQITAALSQAVSREQVAHVIINQGLNVVKADSGLIIVRGQQETLEILDYFGYPAEVVAPWQAFPLDAPVPISETVRTGKPIFVNTFAELKRLYPAVAAHTVSGHEAMVALPLAVEERVIGAIGLSFNRPGHFSEETRDFMMVLARQCAQALERARLYEAERQARAEAEAARPHLAALAEIRERNRLAQELHDTIAQAIGYLNLKLTMASQSLDNGHIEEVQAALQELKQISNETYTDVREEIFNLKSNISAGLSFLETLQDYVEKYRRFYRLNVEIEQNVPEACLKFSDEDTTQLIRIVQEALINVRKHANVDQAKIKLEQTPTTICISVEDKGRGFDDSQRHGKSSSSFGLKIMKERAEGVGATLEINSTPGQGTKINVHYPKK